MLIEYKMPKGFYKLREPIMNVIRKTLLTTGTRPAIVGCYVGHPNLTSVNHLGVIEGSTVTPMDIAIKISSYHLYVRPSAVSYSGSNITSIDTSMQYIDDDNIIVDYSKSFDNIKRLTVGDLGSDIFLMEDGSKDLTNEVIAEFPSPVSFTLHLAITIIDGDKSNKETEAILPESFFPLPANLMNSKIFFDIPEDEPDTLRVKFYMPDFMSDMITDNLCNKLSDIFQTPHIE